MPFLIMAVVLLKRGAKYGTKSTGMVGGEREGAILHEHNDM